MSQKIEDYALIGDCQTAALVGRDGSVDWLCLPRFDSPACFAALLGTPEHGQWLLCPATDVRRTSRRYREGTLVLETDYETDEGAVTVIDCMPVRTREPQLVRMVVGRRGRVPMRMNLVIRFDYGSIVPWVRRVEGGISAVAGADSLLLYTDVPLRGENLTTVAEFTVSAGQHVPFVLLWHRFHEPRPACCDAQRRIEHTAQWWQTWSARCTYQGPWREAVLRSLITLKALTYVPTGGILAAATTSLPEQIGGVRNWDYRFCWVRDAAFTLYALIRGGYLDEAKAWRKWLLRAVAGTPSQLNILYGLAGERRLTELELDWLPGYEGSRPVRIGNAAYRQFQLDVFGEVMAALDLARRGLAPNPTPGTCSRPSSVTSSRCGRNRTRAFGRSAARRGTSPIRKSWPGWRWTAPSGPSNARDARGRWSGGVRSATPSTAGLPARLRSRAEYVRRSITARGAVDASLLMIPLVGFLPADDPRVQGTIAAVQRELMCDGFVKRYPESPEVRRPSPR